MFGSFSERKFLLDFAKDNQSSTGKQICFEIGPVIHINTMFANFIPH